MRDPETELSPRLAALFVLPRETSIGEVARRIGALLDERVPERGESRSLLAAAARLGDELADNFAGATDPDLVLLGDIRDLIEKLLTAAGRLDERDLCRDFGLTDTTFVDDRDRLVEDPREALRQHLSGVAEVVVMELWRRGLLRAPNRFSPH